jgi:hypothetical protein
MTLSRSISRTIGTTTRRAIGGGASGGGAASLLLENYEGAAAGYSLRKIRSGYTGAAIRVRRASDSAEMDIGFSGVNLDTESLSTFCSATNGFVTKWYDQSGNEYDATQTIANNQPKIYDSSTGVFTANGKPAIDFDGSNDYFVTPVVASGSVSVFALFEANSAANGAIAFGGRDDSSKSYFFQFGSADSWKFRVVSNNNAISTAIANQFVLSAIVNGTTLAWWANGSQKESVPQVAALVNSTQGIALMAHNSAGGFASQYAGYIQEFIPFLSDQTSNRAGIESDINSFYSVY